MFEPISFRRHNHCHFQNMTNPFIGSTAMNPRINFALGLASATAGFQPMPLTVPFGVGCMPMGAYQQASLFQPLSMYNLGYANFSNFNNFNNFTSFNSLNTFNSFGSFVPTQMSYYNPTLNMPPAPNFNFNFNLEVPQSVYNQSGGVPAPNFNFNFNTTPSSSASPSVVSNPTGEKVSLNSDKYGPKFLEKVKQIAQRLNCNYRDLLGVMNSESGIDASKKNPNGSASGLIQFVESTAKSLGTTTAKLRSMNPIDQLDYVERCIAKSKAAAGFSSDHKLTGGELYALIFLPARAKNEVLTSSGENYYAQNKGLDTNHDGKITKSELDARVKNKYVSDNSFLA